LAHRQKPTKWLHGLSGVRTSDQRENLHLGISLPGEAALVEKREVAAWQHWPSPPAQAGSLADCHTRDKRRKPDLVLPRSFGNTWSLTFLSRGLMVRLQCPVWSSNSYRRQVRYLRVKWLKRAVISPRKVAERRSALNPFPGAGSLLGCHARKKGSSIRLFLHAVVAMWPTFLFVKLFA